MQTVEAFVARSRKEAEENITSLTREAETLRARLQKVEAALGRWKAVAGALESRADEARIEFPPTDLRPAPLESTPSEPADPSTRPSVR